MQPLSALSLILGFLATSTLAAPTGEVPGGPGGGPGASGAPVPPEVGVAIQDPNAHVPVDQVNVQDPNAQLQGLNVDAHANGFSPNPFTGELMVIAVQQQVCKRVEVDIVQKRVAIYKELIKKTIIKEQCTIETAVIIIQNFQNDFNKWVQNVHQGQAGFDAGIADLGEHVFLGQDQELAGLDEHQRLELQDQEIKDAQVVWREQDLVKGDVQIPKELVENGAEVVEDPPANVEGAAEATATDTAAAAEATTTDTASATDAAAATVTDSAVDDVATPTDSAAPAETPDAPAGEAPPPPPPAARRGVARK